MDTRILAIDDNRDNLTALKAAARDALPRCVLSTALDGPQGIELARTEDPDVILLDPVMPGMDGFEVCRRLKADERLRDIPVVFLTALQADRESRIKALKVGAEAFLSKPLDELELVAQVRAMAKLKAANRWQRLERERLAELVVERTRALEAELAERKWIEEALRQSLERFRLANRATFDVIWDWNLQTNAFWWNENLHTTFGYRDEETEPGIESWTSRIHPEDHDRVEKSAREAIASQRETWSDEYRFRRSDGAYAVVADRGFISRDADGRPLRMICAMEDITERKRAEAKIAEQLDELRRWRDALVGREDHMLEMKREVNDLLARLGEPPRYPSAVEGEQ